MSTKEQGTVAVSADPTAPVRPAEAAAQLVRWMDLARADVPTIPPMSLPAAEAQVKRAIEGWRLPVSGHGDERRIDRAELNAWLLHMVALVQKAAPGGD